MASGVESCPSYVRFHEVLNGKVFFGINIKVLKDYVPSAVWQSVGNSFLVGSYMLDDATAMLGVLVCDCRINS